MKLTITALLCPPLLIGGSVAAHTLFEKNIDNGSVPMYAQVTHTGNVVFIDEAEEVFIHVAADKSMALEFMQKRSDQ